MEPDPSVTELLARQVDRPTSSLVRAESVKIWLRLLGRGTESFVQLYKMVLNRGLRRTMVQVSVALTPVPSTAGLTSILMSRTE